MEIDSCFRLGYVIKSHGLKGDVSVFIDADYPEEYTKMESVFVEKNKQLVPFFIDSISLSGDKAIVKFEGVDDINTAKDLKGDSLFLPLSFLPELREDQYYYHELVGYQVIDNNHGGIGTVINVYESPQADLLAIDYQGKEVLIPISDDIVEVVKKERVVKTKLPDGLLEVYISEDEN